MCQVLTRGHSVVHLQGSLWPSTFHLLQSLGCLVNMAWYGLGWAGMHTGLAHLHHMDACLVGRDSSLHAACTAPTSGTETTVAAAAKAACGFGMHRVSRRYKLQAAVIVQRSGHGRGDGDVGGPGGGGVPHDAMQNPLEAPKARSFSTGRRCQLSDTSSGLSTQATVLPLDHSMQPAQ